MIEKIRNATYNLPWWWVLPFALAPLIFVFWSLSLDTQPAQKTQAEILHAGEQLTIQVNNEESYIITMNDLEPDGCSQIGYTKNLGNTDAFYLSCRGQSIASLNCGPVCFVRSRFPLILEKIE